MNLYGLIPLSAWIVTIFVWAFVFGQRRWDALTRAFLLLVGAFALWLTLGLLPYIPAFDGAEDLALRAAIPLWVPLGALVMNFAYRLVGRKPDAAWWVFVALAVAGSAVGAATDLVLQGHERVAWGLADVRDPVLHTLLTLVPASAGGWGLWLVFRERRRSREIMPRRHLGLVLIGGLVALSLALLLNVVLPNLFGLRDTPGFGSSAMVVFVLVVFRAVARHRFLSIGVEQVAGDLFEDAGDGLALLDRAGRVLRINRAGRELLGPVVPGERDVPLSGALSGYTAEPFDQREFAVPSALGERILAASQTTCVGGADGGLILTLHDITGEKRAEEALRRSREELEREIERRTDELRRSHQVETLGLLAGSVAHDLNNLLAAVLGFSSAARDDLGHDHPLREDLDEILGAADRARDIVQQLLAFSRRDKPSRIGLPAAAAVEEALSLVRVSLPPTIEVRLVDRDGGARVEADPSQLRQVVVNLASNASDAMREAGGELSIAVDAVDLDEAAAQALRPALAAGAYVCLTFRDTGPGIAPGIRDRIFEPFFTTREHERRTGLGLTLVWRMVHEHGGAIRVESEPGRGTEVAVFLPRAPGEGRP